MTKEFITQLMAITENVKLLRDSLPNVNADHLEQLNSCLAELDLSQADPEAVKVLQEAFNNLTYEITQTMQRLDEHCNELKLSVEDLQKHSTGMKAYAIAQHS